MKPSKIMMFPLAVGLASPVNAENWVWITDSKSKAKVYYDADTLKREDDVVRLWIRWDYSLDKSTRYRESKHLVSIDCKNETMRLLAIYNYNPDGTVANSNVIKTYEQEDMPAVPGSVTDGVMDQICGFD